MKKITKKELVIICVVGLGLLAQYFLYENQIKKVEGLINSINDGDIDKVKLMVSAGANPNGVAYDGLTPIVAATRRHQYEAVNYLLSIGVDINKGDESNLTPLFYAALQNDEPMYDFLLEKGACFNFPDKLREKYLLDVVVGSNNLRLLNKIRNQLAKEKTAKEGLTGHPC